MGHLTILVIFLAFLMIFLMLHTFKPDFGSKKKEIGDKRLNSVQKADFTAVQLMNTSEFKLYKVICNHINNKSFPIMIFPQVSLGEILRSKDRMAFFSINSKRVDFVVTNLSCMPVAVIEYQGSGHYQGNAIIRDKIKKVACEKAGIKYLPVKGNYSLRDIEDILSILSTVVK